MLTSIGRWASKGTRNRPGVSDVNSDVPGPAQSRKPGQAGPYLGRAKPSPRCWPSKGFGPAHDSSKPEPAAQAAALVLYYITTIYIYMLNKNETFVMNG